MKVYRSEKKEAVRLLKKDLSDSHLSGVSPEQLNFSVNYLSFFGYIGVYLLNNLSIDDLRSAVRKFQKMFGLKQDGVIGPKTQRAMGTPRCGCPDVIDKEQPEHVEYLNIKEALKENQQKWEKRELTYHIDGFVSGLPQKTQREIISDCFGLWTAVCGIQVQETRKSLRPDILIGVGEGKEHDFDGRGGTLGWAYLPRGDKQLRMRFDLAETWVNSSTERGIMLATVAAHEIGHLLGLRHSQRKRALMAPYYNPYVSTPQQSDDIPRVQNLYGPPRESESLLSPPNRIIEIKAGESVLIKSCN